MPSYLYKARTKEGELKKGEIEAVDEEGAATLLREHGLTLTSLTLKEKATGIEQLSAIFQRVKTKDKVIFTRQFATIIKSGLPIIQALKILAEQTQNKKLKDILFSVATDVEGGTSLSESFSRFPKVFPKVYIALIKSGEASGNLDEVLLRLADQLEKDYETLSKIKGALYYPGFIFSALIMVGSIMMIYVVPQLSSLFKEANVELPWTTKLLIGVSNFLAGFWWLVLILIVGMIAGIRAFIQTESGRQAWDKMKIHLPIFGVIVKKIYMARFTRTLGTLVAGGLPILEALEITADAVGNAIYKEGILSARGEVENGVALAIPLKANENFPPMVPQMIAVGEQTGKLDDVLTKLSEFFDREVDTATKSISSLLEPILMVIMGLGVGILVTSIIMPIYNLAQVL